MGLQEVKDEILNEAEEKAEQLRVEGDEEAQKIIQDAEEKAEQIEKESEENIDAEKEALRQKEISKANMEAKKKVQTSKESSVNKVFEKFGEELENLSEKDRETLLENAKAQAAFEVDSVKGSEEFEDLVDEIIDEKGLILESSDGEKSLNLTFSRIQEEYRKNYRSDVARILFDEV